MILNFEEQSSLEQVLKFEPIVYIVLFDEKQQLLQCIFK